MWRGEKKIDNKWNFLILHEAHINNAKIHIYMLSFSFSNSFHFRKRAHFADFLMSIVDSRLFAIMF